MDSTNQNAPDTGASTVDQVTAHPVGICGKPVGQPVGTVIVPAQQHKESNNVSN